MISYKQKTNLRGLAKTDRAALVTFSKKSQIKVPLTENLSQIELFLHETRPMTIGFHPPGLFGKTTRIRLWEAVSEASSLFDQTDRTRVLIALFADEDPSTGPEIEVARKALHSSKIVLCAAAVGKESPLKQAERDAQTPPTTPGRHPQLTVKRGEIPGQTLDAARKLAEESGGSVSRDEWNLPAFIRQIRAQP